MRRLFVLALSSPLLAAGRPRPRARTAPTLWACHGTEPAARCRSATPSQDPSRAAFSAPSGGCGAPGGTIRLGFLHPDPADGHFASLRFAVTVRRERRPRLARPPRQHGPGYWAKHRRPPSSSRSTVAGLARRRLSTADRRAGSGSSSAAALRRRSGGALRRRRATRRRLPLRGAGRSATRSKPERSAVTGIPSFAQRVASTSIVDASATPGLGLGERRRRRSRAVPSVARSSSARATAASSRRPTRTIDLPLAEDCPAARRVVLARSTPPRRRRRRRSASSSTVQPTAPANATVRGFDLEGPQSPARRPRPTPTPARAEAAGRRRRRPRRPRHADRERRRPARSPSTTRSRARGSFKVDRDAAPPPRPPAASSA